MKRERVFIRLSEIPDEGRSFNYDRTSGEFNFVLKDLIEDNPYSIKFDVRPVGNIFEVTGNIKTQLARMCSKCGEDVHIPVQTRIHEILLPRAEDAKGDSQSKSGFLPSEETDSALAVTYISAGVLNAEEMIHEIVGISEPVYPVCSEDGCKNIEEVQKKLRELEEAAEMALQGKNTAFEVLKTLKLQ